VISAELRRRHDPDDRPDTTEMLYGWIREHGSPASHVLNLGAGPATRLPVKVLRGEVARLVGRTSIRWSSTMTSWTRRTSWARPASVR